ncbi:MULTISPECIES: CPBP family intramembrane glutamic endopeptidase [Actinomycetes]|uniref:CPBP family intramembrane glutamic endopeptidase n=1 Tax=Actinomycetes TaxID=1760 RepID=UPI00131A3658|nr:MULTISPECIES: CPBP family intramembrane glutamic endopeptidase [Actinomycetes]
MLTRWLGHVRRHPLAGAVEVALSWEFAIVGSAKLLPVLDTAWFPGLGSVAVNLIATGVMLVILRSWGWLRPAGVTAWGRFARWPVVLPLFFVAALSALPGIEGSATQLVTGAAVMLCVGISEEISSRALVLEVARPLGLLRASALTAVLFGAGHLKNYLFFGASLNNTLWQMLSAGLFGFCLCAARLAIGTVWPLVLLHALSDYLQIYSPGKDPDWLWTLNAIVNLGLGAALLRWARNAPAAESASTAAAN